MYDKVGWKEQTLCRRPGAKTGRRQQQLAQNLPSSIPQVVEWTRRVGLCTARGPGNAQHQPGMSTWHTLKQTHTLLDDFFLFSWFVNLFCYCRWWTWSGSLVWQWAPTRVDLSTLRTSLCRWRSLSLLDRFVRGLLRWPFHSFRYVLLMQMLCCSSN